MHYIFFSYYLKYCFSCEYVAHKDVGDDMLLFTDFFHTAHHGLYGLELHKVFYDIYLFRKFAFIYFENLHLFNLCAIIQYRLCFFFLYFFVMFLSYYVLDRMCHHVLWDYLLCLSNMRHLLLFDNKFIMGNGYSFNVNILKKR